MKSNDAAFDTSEYIPLVLTVHKNGYTASREIPFEVMLNPSAMKGEYERLREVIDAQVEGWETPRFRTQKDAENYQNAIPPVIQVATTTGVEKRVNPQWKLAPFTVRHVPVKRGDESTTQ